MKSSLQNTPFSEICSLSPIDRLWEAFQEASQREAQKTVGERFQEQVLIPFYMLKGATKGALHLLESGLNPLTKGLENSIRQTVSPRRIQTENQKKLSAANELCQEAIRDPNGLLDRGIGAAANRLVAQALRFLQADVRQRGEMAGEAAAGLALMLLTRKLPPAISLGLKLNARVNPEK